LFFYYLVNINNVKGKMPLGTLEILIIALIILLLFGSKKLPELARSLGKAIKEFKKGLKEEKR